MTVKSSNGDVCMPSFWSTFLYSCLSGLLLCRSESTASGRHLWHLMAAQLELLRARDFEISSIVSDICLVVTKLRVSWGFCRHRQALSIWPLSLNSEAWDHVL